MGLRLGYGRRAREYSAQWCQRCGLNRYETYEALYRGADIGCWSSGRKLLNHRWGASEPEWEPAVGAMH